MNYKRIVILSIIFISIGCFVFFDYHRAVNDFKNLKSFLNDTRYSNDETSMENLARYIIRDSFSQERMQYLDQEAKVVYVSKDGKATKVFPALEWLASMFSHIPNRGKQRF